MATEAPPVVRLHRVPAPVEAHDVVDVADVLSVHVLGPVEVHQDGHPVELGGPQQRAVIAHLAIDAGKVVSVERLIDRLWGDEPPRTPLGTLQSYVSRLRRSLEPQRGSGAAPQVLVSEAPGYVLRLPPEQIDVHRFRALVADGRALAGADRHAEALGLFNDALALWRGPALAGVGPDEQVRPIVVRLDEEREAAIEDRFESLLALGRHAEAVPRLQAAVEEQPLRERRWALLALALYRSARQADALRALSNARTILLDELGLDPGPELRELENRILAQDPTLLLTVTEHHITPAPAAEAGPAPQTQLVGRGEEWQVLVDSLAAARAGQPRFVLVEGEPGIGKSTLCSAFLAHAAASGCRTTVGHCVEPGLAPSLWPAIEIVREVVGDASPDDVAVAGLNPLRRYVAGGTEAGTSLAPVEMADHFIALLDELEPTPWVILVDDLHWADRATLDVLRLVLDRLGSRPVMVMGAHRPPEIEPGHPLGESLGRLQRSPVPTVRVHLSPLDAAAVAELMEVTSGVAPSAELAEQVQARAGGNPLFVTELARLAGERGLRDASLVPDAIRDVVRGRLAGLPERATAELEVAAVLGERFDLRTLMAASERDPDDCLDALDAAIVTRILVPEGHGFRFAHALVRDAVLAELSSLRLARLHQRAAEAIRTTWGDSYDEAEPIAHHLLASAALSDPVTVARAAIRASDSARWRSAVDTAEMLADRALEVLATAPRKPEVAKTEVDALEAFVAAKCRRLDPESQLLAARRADEFAERTGSEAATALALFLNWGDVDETDDLSTLAEYMVPVREFAEHASDAYAVVTTRHMLAAYALLTGSVTEAAEHAAIAIAASGSPDPDTPPDHVPLVVLPVVAGMIAALRGDAEKAHEHTYRRASAWLWQRTQVDPTAEPALAFNRALVQAMLDRPEAVIEALHGTVRTDEAGMIDHQAATCDLLAAWARCRRGDSAALAEGFVAMAELETSHERVLRSCLRTLLADACLALNDPRAVELLATARAEALSRGEVWWLAETTRLQAVADLRFGDGSATARLLDEAEAIASAQGATLLLPRIAATRASLAGADH